MKSRSIFICICTDIRFPTGISCFAVCQIFVLFISYVCFCHIPVAFTWPIFFKELQVEANSIDEVCSEASALGNDIIGFNNLPEVDEAIHMQIDSARRPLAGMLEELKIREQKLKDQLQRTGQFQDQFEDFERRLKNFDAKICEMKELPIPAKSSKVAVMMGNLEVCKE